MLVSTDATRLPDPATPAYKAMAVGTANATTSLTVNVPTGTEQGDRLILSITKTTAAALSGLDAWTLVSSQEPAGAPPLYIYERVAGFTEVGERFPVSGVTSPAIAKMSTSRLVYIDGTNDELRAYDYVDGVFSLHASLALSDTSFNAVCALSATRIAHIDETNKVLQAYDLTAGVWAAVGNPLSIANTAYPAICALSSTRIAFIDGVNDSLRAYDFDGTDWTLVGNALAVSTVGAPAVCALSSTRIAFTDATNQELRAYSFDGTNWTLTGNALDISSYGSAHPKICTITSGQIIYVDDAGRLRAFNFDETDWTLASSASIGTMEWGALAQIDGTTFAYVDGINDQLRAYDYDLPASYTVTWTGNDDAVICMVAVGQCGARVAKQTDTGISNTPTCPALPATGSANNLVMRFFSAEGASVNNAVAFDGTNDYLTRGADLTGNVDGKSGLISVWVEFTGGDGAVQLIMSNETASGGILLYKQADNTLRLLGFSTGGILILDMVSSSTYTVSSGWQHLLVAWNLATGVGQLYINDADDLAASPTLTDDTIDYTSPDFVVGDDLFGGGKLNANVVTLYVNLAETLDISVEANRRKFFSAAGLPVNLGSDGSAPTGMVPIIFLDGLTADWHTNKGSGGGFTENGELTEATTSPFAPAGTTVVAVRASPNNLVMLGLAYEAVPVAGTDIGTAAFAALT